MKATEGARGWLRNFGRCSPNKNLLPGLLGKIHADDGGFFRPYAVECNNPEGRVAFYAAYDLEEVSLLELFGALHTLHASGGDPAVPPPPAYSVGTNVTFAIAAEEADWTHGCPGLLWHEKLAFSAGSTDTVAELKDGCFRSATWGHLWAPLSALDKPHASHASYDAECAAHTACGTCAAAPHCLWCGDLGTCSALGASTCMHKVYTESGCPAAAAPPAPVGGFKSGDRVTTAMYSSAADWSACPPPGLAFVGRLAFFESQLLTIGTISGACFTTDEYSLLWAPLSALVGGAPRSTATPFPTFVQASATAAPGTSKPAAPPNGDAAAPAAAPDAPAAAAPPPVAPHAPAAAAFRPSLDAGAEQWSLPVSNSGELYVSFRFTPDASGSNAFGISARPTGGSIFTPYPIVEILYQNQRRCLSPAVNMLAGDVEQCNFARPMLYVLNIESGAFNLMKGGLDSNTAMPLGHVLPADGHFRLYARGGVISNVEILTEEERFEQRHIKAGATKAVAGGSASGMSLCSSGSAECGGSCWGVCIACGPPKYCMCYPNGYVGVDGHHYAGAHCLKHDGAGTSVTAPAAAEHHYRAHAEL